MKLKAILFDVDGTLLDTREFIFQASEHTLTKHGFKIPKREMMATFVGGSLKRFYEKVAPRGEFKLLRKTQGEFQLNNVHLVSLFPEVAETLKKLKRWGFKLGAITSRHKETLIEILEYSGIIKFFDVVISADDVKYTKPHPEPILKALKKLKVKPEDALVVGDAVYDIEAGKKAGVKTVAVTYGFGGKKVAEAKPDFVIDDINKLLSLW